MNKHERLAIFILRLLSLVTLIYFLAVAVIFVVMGRGGMPASIFTLCPAVIALIVYFCAPILARLVAKDLD